MQHFQSYLIKSVLLVLLLITPIWIPRSHYRSQESQTKLTIIEAINGKTVAAPPHYSSPSKVDIARLRSIVSILRTTRLGVIAIQQLKELGVGVRFEDDKGSSFDPKNNQIVIDAGYNPIRASLALVHELTHASYNIQTINADILADDRQMYIDRQIDEEVTSIINGIELKWELASAGFDVSDIHYPLEFLYRQPGEQQRVSDPPQVQEDLFRLFEYTGNEDGRMRLLAGFFEGKTWIPTTGETYPEYYGRYWDSAHSSS